MLKKILSASLVVLQLLTQSASALELRPISQPIIQVQSLQVSSDILKNKNPFSSVNDFLFFNISDISVNQPLSFGQGLSVFSGVSANQTLSNPAGWRLTGAYDANFPALITLNGFSGNPSSNRKALLSKSLARFWQSRSLLGINSGGFSVSNEAAVIDGENRLITVRPTTPILNDKKIDSRYDYQGRRVRRVVSNWNGTAWVVQTTKSYVYDGWNVIEEITAGQPAKYYAWGLDLSQSLQGAGGVGGLLAKIESSATQQYLYDGNGNIGQLINNAGGALLAQYEYDPYGNSIVATGTQAATNQFRFSTKYIDTEYNLYYYGYRFYDPATGRWVNRDPIGENGGVLLYGFVYNNPFLFVDDLGHQPLASQGIYKSMETILGTPDIILPLPNNVSWQALPVEDLGLAPMPGTRPLLSQRENDNPCIIEIVRGLRARSNKVNGKEFYFRSRVKIEEEDFISSPGISFFEPGFLPERRDQPFVLPLKLRIVGAKEPGAKAEIIELPGEFAEYTPPEGHWDVLAASIKVSVHAKSVLHTEIRINQKYIGDIKPIEN